MVKTKKQGLRSTLFSSFFFFFCLNQVCLVLFCSEMIGFFFIWGLLFMVWFLLLFLLGFLEGCFLLFFFAFFFCFYFLLSTPPLL